TDGIAVFRTVQPMDQRLARVRACQSGAIQCRFEIALQTVECRWLRPARPLRVKCPSLQLTHHLFPGVRVARNGVEADAFERQSRLSEALAVAGRAILLD